MLLGLCNTRFLIKNRRIGCSNRLCLGLGRALTTRSGEERATTRRLLLVENGGWRKKVMSAHSAAECVISPVELLSEWVKGRPRPPEDRMERGNGENVTDIRLWDSGYLVFKFKGRFGRSDFFTLQSWWCLPTFHYETSMDGLGSIGNSFLSSLGGNKSEVHPDGKHRHGLEVKF